MLPKRQKASTTWKQDFQNQVAKSWRRNLQLESPQWASFPLLRIEISDENGNRKKYTTFIDSIGKETEAVKSEHVSPALHN